MKKIFILRHGKYNSDKTGADLGLSEEGKDGVKELVERLREALEERDIITLMSSTAKRAVETAEIIKDELNLKEIISEEKLRSDGPENFNWLKKTIDEFTGTALIIISHLEFVTDFPTRNLNFYRDYAPNCYGFLITDGKCSHF